MKKYEYTFVEAKVSSLFSPADHKEIINEYAEKGWRFVTAIPSSQKMDGYIYKFDLVFEKELLN